MLDPLSYFLLALKAAFLSSGGLGSIPSLHQDFLLRHWASDRQFAGSLSIGQIAPGPTGLWVIALGYMTAGVTGVALMTVAILVPPLLVIPLSRLHGRVADKPLVRGFARGLTIAAASTVPAVVIFRVLGTFGYAIESLLILFISVILIAWGRVPAIAVLGLAALAGTVLLR
jgi:chromate transporter